MAGPNRGPIGLWSLPEGRKEFYEMHQHKNAVTAVAIGADGTRALTGGGEKGPEVDNAIRIWDLAQKKVTGQLEGSKQIIACLAFGVDPNIAFSGDGRTVTEWDLNQKKGSRSWTAHDTKIHCLAVLPDGKQLLTGGTDNETGGIILWNIDNSKKTHSFTGHTAAVHGIAVSADGTRFASASQDGSVRVWDVTSAKELHAFRGHKGSVISVAIRGDGKRVLSGGADGTIRLWDLDSNAQLLLFAGHKKGVTSVAFTPDGRTAVSAGSDQQIRVWKLP